MNNEMISRRTTELVRKCLTENWNNNGTQAVSQSMCTSGTISVNESVDYSGVNKDRKLKNTVQGNDKENIRSHRSLKPNELDPKFDELFTNLANNEVNNRTNMTSDVSCTRTEPITNDSQDMSVKDLVQYSGQNEWNDINNAEQEDETENDISRISSEPNELDPEVSAIFASLSDDSVKDPDFNHDSEHNNGTVMLDISSPETEQKTYATLLPVVTSEWSPETDSSVSIENKGRPKRGRKRKFGNMSREERKNKKYQCKEYVNYKKKKIAPKEFVSYDCQCTSLCATKISEELSRQEFQRFCELGSYTSQNLFIIANIVETKIARKRSSEIAKKQKQFSRAYSLKKIPVCRNMLMKTLGVSTKRINTALSKMRQDTTITDKRGTQGGWNKITETLRKGVLDHIKLFPKYKSHYRRAEIDAEFLPPEMTLTKMYELYGDGRNKADMVSFSTYKKSFYENFNLKFKTLKKDTCNTCDKLNIQIQNVENVEEKNQLERNHDEHITMWQEAQRKLKDDMKFASYNDFFECLTFDLQKTLPLPRIPTNLIFYKRQLWVYNCGIHSGKLKRGFCYPWVEGVAGRGAQEVASCLLKHIEERVPDGVTELVLWSDSCGGQNCNIKMVLMLKCALHSHPSLRKITMRFPISGHSYLPNDDDFGKIESALKRQQRLYSPEDYYKIMKICRKKNPLVVTPMESGNFFGIAENIEKHITNRKKGVNGEDTNWLKTREIVLIRYQPYSILMKQSLNDEAMAVEIDISKRTTRGRPLDSGIQRSKLNALWPRGKGIAREKLNDIKSLLHLIPKDCQSFYSTLFADDTVEDDIHGYTGPLDFEPNPTI